MRVDRLNIISKKNISFGMLIPVDINNAKKRQHTINNKEKTDIFERSKQQI